MLHAYQYDYVRGYSILLNVPAQIRTHPTLSENPDLSFDAMDFPKPTKKVKMGNIGGSCANNLVTV